MILDNPNRRPQTFGGVIYLLVVAMAVAGMASTLTGAWRPGVSWLGASLLVGSVGRLLLPEHRAGMLRVRHKLVDVAAMTLVGVTLLTLAAVIPRPPG